MAKIYSYPKLGDVKTIGEIIDEIVESKVKDYNSIFNKTDPADFKERVVIIDDTATLCYKSTLDALERRRAVARVHHPRKRVVMTAEEKEQNRETTRHLRMVRLARMTEDEINLLRDHLRQRQRRKAQELKRRKTPEELELIRQRRRKNNIAYRERRALRIMKAEATSSTAYPSKPVYTDSHEEIIDNALKLHVPKEVINNRETEKYLKMEILKEGSSGNQTRRF